LDDVPAVLVDGTAVGETGPHVLLEDFGFSLSIRNHSLITSHPKIVPLKPLRKYGPNPLLFHPLPVQFTLELPEIGIYLKVAFPLFFQAVPLLHSVFILYYFFIGESLAFFE